LILFSLLSAKKRPKKLHNTKRPKAKDSGVFRENPVFLKIKRSVRIAMER
jgi:hypothetical protein